MHFSARYQGAAWEAFAVIYGWEVSRTFIWLFLEPAATFGNEVERSSMEHGSCSRGQRRGRSTRMAASASANAANQHARSKRLSRLHRAGVTWSAGCGYCFVTTNAGQRRRAMHNTFRQCFDSCERLHTVSQYLGGSCAGCGSCVASSILHLSELRLRFAFGRLFGRKGRRKDIRNGLNTPLTRVSSSAASFRRGDNR